MLKSRLVHLVFIFMLLMVGCAKESEQPAEVMSKSALRENDATRAPSPPKNSRLQIKDRKIIKTGFIEFQTASLSKARKQIDHAINKYNGYISNEQETSYNDRIQQRIVVRVPADKFDSLVADATKGIKKFDQKRIDAHDVTEEFLDITARLKIKKGTEQRYLQLLAKAKTVKDILAIEKQIESLRSDIESIEGRLKYLKSQIAYSTLTVTVYEKVSTPVGFTYKFKSGLKNGWNNFVWFLVGIINIWPFILFGIAGIFGIKFYRKRKKK